MGDFSAMSTKLLDINQGNDYILGNRNSLTDDVTTLPPFRRRKDADPRVGRADARLGG